MDNQEAELKVAQEMPFVTGQYTSATAVAGGQGPFQTIQREEVGTILKVTPTIYEGSQVLLKIAIESSSIGAKPAGRGRPLTNKRTINTTRADRGRRHRRARRPDRGHVTKSESRVPVLGSIPLLGDLFKTRSATSHQEQPDGVHPAEDPARPAAGRVRDRHQVQLHARRSRRA